MLADGVTLLANGSHKLDVFRRHAFKGDMKDEYSSICTGSYPAKGSLFGPDMHERIREVNESLRVARSTRRFQPYQKPQKGFLFKRKQGVEEKRGWDGDAGRLHTTSSKEQLGATEADLPQEKISQVSVSTCSSMLKGGKIKHFMHEWTKYTSDPFICVNGCKLFFLTQPSQDKLPHPIKL